MDCSFDIDAGLDRFAFLSLCWDIRFLGKASGSVGEALANEVVHDYGVDIPIANGC